MVGNAKCLAAVALLISAACLSADAIDDGVRVVPATNLVMDGSEAERKGVAILLEFAAEGCPYCVLLEEEFLKPMLRSGDYDNKVIMRVVDIDHGKSLTDFQGNRSTSAAFAHRFNVDLTPTVMLVNSRGKPLVEPIVGIWSLDFFGGVLDGRIDAAVDQVQQVKQAGHENDSTAAHVESGTRQPAASSATERHLDRR